MNILKLTTVLFVLTITFASCTSKTEEIPIPSSIPFSEVIASPESQLEVNPPTNWQTYTSTQHGFSISYPKEIKVTSESDTAVNFNYVGKEVSSIAEVSDGFFLRITSGDLSADIKSFVMSQEKRTSDEHKITKKTESIQIGEETGYQFTALMVSPVRYIYVKSSKPNQLIEISDSTSDPEEKGYAQTVNQMLASFKLL
ncbi:MAG: hypothetical protein M3Q44_00510 [bacterium]|nr:hypothetical protein [bacterium]